MTDETKPQGILSPVLDREDTCHVCFIGDREVRWLEPPREEVEFAERLRGHLVQPKNPRTFH